MDDILIDNSAIDIEFTNHLKLINNKRVLFTASFGSGKSFFIKNYFKRHKDHLDITLFPVDYSVNSNEDIFETIKYDIIDILFEKFAKVLELKAEDFSNLLLAQNFVAHRMNFIPFLTSIIKGTGIATEQILDTFEASKNVLTQFTNSKEELNSNEKDILVKYMTELESKKGLIRERDEITILINDFLNRIRSRRKGKKIVLVIDDLDRLDPEQIFRLFNIFSAHHDSRTDVNKFGFDKIIFVCDLNNIEYMFQHRYGIKSNFDGYIDKFYSHKPFFFNHRTFLKEKVVLYLTRNLKATDGKISEIDWHTQLYGAKSEFYHAMVQLNYLLVDKNLLRARNFQKYKSYELPIREIRIGHRDFQVTKFPLLVMFHMMQQFFPRVTDLLGTITTLKQEYESNYESKYNYGSINWENLLISYSIPFFIENFAEKDFDRDGNSSQFVSLNNEFGEKIFLEYKTKESLMNDYVAFSFLKAVSSATSINGDSAEPPFSKPNPYNILELALKSCLIKGYIFN